MEETSIWSFPDRGKWATHSGEYRGNWSPYIPRNLILRYSKEGDWVLDQFLGSGTTLIEAKLLNRNAIGVDVNPDALELSRLNLSFSYETQSKIFLKQGDARELGAIKNESIDLICMHPPYADIIKYSCDIKGDISHQHYNDFLESMSEVASSAYRVLKRGCICAYMIGDIREHGYVKPLGMESMQRFIREGFLLKEIIIKEQHNCRSSDYWDGRPKKFIMLAHEYIFVLEKK